MRPTPASGSTEAARRTHTVFCEPQMEDDPTTLPRLPPGSTIELCDRGSTFVRTVEGPPGTPAVVLLHGLAATADLNWFSCFDELGKSFSVLAPDLRGHGAGVGIST